MDKHGLIGFLFGMILLFPATMGFLVADVNDPDYITDIVVNTFVASIGFICIIFGILAYLDKKDHWKVILPYNTLLYNLVDQKVTVMLRQDKIEFSEKRNFILKYVIKDEETEQPVGGAYKIYTDSGEPFDFEYALTVKRIKHSVYYNLQLSIINIKLSNLESAKHFQKKIQNILEAVEYKKFKEVRKV